MLNHLVAAGAATALAIQGVTAQQCSAGTASEIHGNWYCSAVDSISYTNFPGTGFYNKVTNMDASTGTCATVKHTYSGSLSPLNEEVCTATIQFWGIHANSNLPSFLSTFAALPGLKSLRFTLPMLL